MPPESYGWKLDDWSAGRIGGPLTRENLEEYRLRALREVLSHVRRHSPFYARRLKDARLDSLGDIESLPFTDARDLAENPLAFLCAPQDEVARVATFAPAAAADAAFEARSSGTRGAPKRIFFTDEDLENTIDFFANGMSHIPGARVFICLGKPTPGSVSALLAGALARTGRAGIVGGPVRDPEETLRAMRDADADSLVGMPSQMLALARFPARERAPLRSLLLSGDYASDALTGALEDAFGCPVFRHYGMAETGYGAAVECARRWGLHVREADLLFEVVEPNGEKKLPDGEWGELAVTSLTRRGMPLIRYRTGDLGRVLPGACPCGSPLTRLEIRGRLDGVAALPAGEARLDQLDDALRPLPWLSDFDAAQSGESLEEKRLRVILYCARQPPDDWDGRARKALEPLGPLRFELELSRLPISPLAGKKTLKRI